MRRLLSFAALLVAWGCAQGALMNTVQVFAWARMFAGYAQTMSWSEAVRETFDPNKPCEICVAVMNARAEEQEAPPTSTAAGDAPKLVLFLTETADGIVALARAVEFGRDDGRPQDWCPAVPTPPPRGARA